MKPLLPRVVCFDLGGVLVRIASGWSAAARLAGYDCHAVLPAELEARREALFLGYQRGALATEHFFASVASLLPGATPQVAEAIHLAWLRDEYAGVWGLLRRLRVAHPELRLACFSNTNAAHWQLLAAPQLQSRFPALGELHETYVSHELQLAKPDLSSFVAVQRALGCTPSELLFFDDTKENVHAARACGWRAEWVAAAGTPVEQLTSYCRHAGLRV